MAQDTQVHDECAGYCGGEGLIRLKQPGGPVFAEKIGRNDCTQYAHDNAQLVDFIN